MFVYEDQDGIYIFESIAVFLLSFIGSHEVLLSDIVPWDLQWQGETPFLDVVAATFRLTPRIEEDNFRSADKEHQILFNPKFKLNFVFIFMIWNQYSN